MENTDQSSSSLVGYTTRDLYGGAIKISIPNCFIDGSNIREVPDNQELFLDVNASNRSIIIELLSFEQVKDEESVKYFFVDLCETNDCNTDELAKIHKIAVLTKEQVPHFDEKIYTSVLYGEQHIAKARQTNRDLVMLYLVNIRLPHVSTDILINFHEPKPDPTEEGKAKNNTSTTTNNPNTNIHNLESAEQIIMNMLKSFEIKDYSLFQN